MSAAASIAPATLIHARDVRMTYGAGGLATPVLHGVSLDLHAGELALVMGPSGSGKTTLISILAGLLRPTSGTVRLCGSDVSRGTEGDAARVRRAHVGFVFQQYNLFPALSALENVASVLRIKGAKKEVAAARATAALDRVGLGERLHHRPRELSGGQQQRVAIARALAGDPTIIIGDEVTGALDGATALDVMRVLRDYVSPRTAVVIVTHDHRLERFAERVVELEDGQIAADRRTGGRS